MKSCTITLFYILSIFGTLASDLPCAARSGDNDQGYICVCNSTNSDTVGAPVRLSSGSFYHYKTSNSTPGFTSTVAHFTNSSATTGTLASDLPCAARSGDNDQGYICVCNSTYCDTVGAPVRLSSGSFYHYKTSNSTPGFTFTVANFTNSSATTGTLASDLPCAARSGDNDQGYICVCNSTYCDTVGAPVRLSSGSFYHYKTSNSTPGFTFTVANFTNSSATTGTLASDLPCAVRSGDNDQGYICVCNSTYCDTVGAPVRLSSGSFYHYKTSNSTPGFTSTVAHFTNSSATTGTLASDLPCAARSGDNDQGYICVCNSTYCDTVGAPVRLSSGSFYHYKTSNSTPGFTFTVANFTNSSATTGTLASDLPCAARSGDNDQGYICVCNSTNSDTVGAPVRLSSGSFYHYKTSNSTPGFTSTVANFTNSSATTGTLASDLPCAARSGDNDQGYICVCNSTYCDTVGAPVRLSSGSFYHYKTSNSTPGFTSTVANFTNSSATTGTLASDLPCAARSGDNDQGYICVCNSTYCDTVGAPVRLSSGSFYHYKTSNFTPGFTFTVANFTNSSATTGTLASDLPCAARSGDNDQGYICVCNSTYCDTVGAPVRLSSGSFYHYKTSNSTPGFTFTVANFTNSSATAGTLASDLPCAARSGDNDQGYICVCNSTYCDTVGAPVRLSSGSFYHYKTSNSTPGFTSTVANFTNSSATTGTLASDLPCAARSGDNDQGYICVCNSTYCDTVGAPVRLSSGSFYHYKTSNSTPGFTSTVANFTNSSATTGTLASDLPCAARSGDNDQGYICVCNSTYCDTVGAPVRLSSGSFYHYKTSNSTPGFTSTVAHFTNSSVVRVDDVVFTINSSTEYQTVIGFGGSITDTAGLVMSHLPQGAQEKFIESYFGPSGIEYSMLRVPIGGSDFSTRSYTLDDVPFDEDLEHFSLSDEDYNIKIPLIKKATAVSNRGIKLLACSWAAPSWMKSNNSTNPGYISKRYQETWAKYHIRFLEEYQKEGLTVWSLSGGNEVALLYILPTQVVTLNSTLNLATNQIHWLKNYLKPLLVASNFSQVKFLTLEDQRIFAPYWMARFADDPEAYKALDGIALHWYMDRYIPNSVLDNLHSAYPDKLIMSTESSINTGIYDGGVVAFGSWARAEKYLYNIFQNVDHWTNAYLDWNLALDVKGGPSLSFGIDAAVIVNQTSGEFYKQPMFYAMGHFSKFVQPESKKVHVSSNQNSTSSFGVVKSEKDLIKQVLLSTKLTSAANQSLGFDIQYFLNLLTTPFVVKALAFTNPDDSFVVMILNTKNETAHVRIEDPRMGIISASIEKNSINTFVYWP